MTKRSLILLAVAVGGLIGWVGLFAVYLAFFPEEGSVGGDIVLATTSALVGLAATIAFGVSMWRTPGA